jgi:hypothetical protein
MAPLTAVLYLRVLHSHFSTDFGLEKLSTSIFPETKNNSIQNGVNIQDDDFTFIHPSV